MDTKIAVVPVPLSAANLVALITAAYKAACDHWLTTLTGEALKRKRNKLFWGSLPGSKVLGVNSQNTVDKMLRSSIMAHGLMRPVSTDRSGNYIYCFKLSHYYNGKGKTTYGRISDLLESKKLGELQRENIGIGIDYDEVTDVERTRLEAPQIKEMDSNMITVILGPDNNTFVEWFCGEPRKLYDASNVMELIDHNGELDLTKAWIQISLDYNQRTKERRRRIYQEREHNTQQNTKHSADSINSLESALGAAMDNALPKPEASTTEMPAVS